jgi:hypothetical protein
MMLSMISCDFAEAASSTLRQVVAVAEMGSCWGADGSDLGGDLVAGLPCSLVYRTGSDIAGRCFELLGLM